MSNIVNSVPQEKRAFILYSKNHQK